MKKEVFEKIKEIIKIKKLDIDLTQNEEKIIKEFQNKVDWEYISALQNLSENFIREFQDKIIWNCISIKQNLSESFIREFQDKVNWEYISRYQILSESFIREFQDRVSWDCINENKKIIKTKEFQELINRELLIQELHR